MIVALRFKGREFEFRCEQDFHFVILDLRSLQLE